MPSNDNNKANTAASGWHTKRGVTPLVSTATGVWETSHNNPNCPGTRTSKSQQFPVMPPLPLTPPPRAAKKFIVPASKATPALKIPATADGTIYDEETPTLMQLKGPPEVKTQQHATTDKTQTLLQLKDPPVFETWQHVTPEETLTLMQLKDHPEINMLQDATTLSTASQLKDNDYNSCVEWAVADASADGDGEYDSDIEGDFKHLDSDGFKKPAAKSNKRIGGVFSPTTSTTTVAFRILKRFMARHEILSSLKPVCVSLINPTKEDEDDYKDDKLFQDDTAEDNLEEDMAYYCVNIDGGVFFQLVDHQGLTLLE
jgi:hypothetical protein